MYDFAKENAPIDRTKIRQRYRKMTDEQLPKEGKAAAFLCSPEANHGQPPRETFIVQ